MITTETVAALDQNLTDLRYLPSVSEAIRRSMLVPEFDASVRDARKALLISAVDPTTTIYIPLVRRLYGQRGPQSCHLLFSTYDALKLTRLGANRFSLERVSSGLTSMDVYATIFNRTPFLDGQRFDVAGIRVTVDEADGGLLRKVSYETDVSLDDPSIVLLHQSTLGLKSLVFPEIGASTLVAPPMLPLPIVPDDSHIR
jgi:hypothetical protein